MLALWAASLREIKTRIRPLFRQERGATNAGLFLEGLLGDEQRKTGWMRAEAAGDPWPYGVEGQPQDWTPGVGTHACPRCGWEAPGAFFGFIATAERLESDKEARLSRFRGGSRRFVWCLLQSLPYERSSRSPAGRSWLRVSEFISSDRDVNSFLVRADPIWKRAAFDMQV